MNIRKKNVRKPVCLISAVLCATLFFSGCTEVDESLPEPKVITDVTDTAPVSSDGEEKGYILSQLSEQEWEYYVIMRDAVRNFEDEAVFPEPLPAELLRKLFVTVYYQEEDIFWLDSLFYSRPTDFFSQKLTYRFSKEEAAAMQQELDKRVNEIFSRFTPSSTDYEKLLTFHDELVLGCTLREGEKYSNTVYGALVAGQAQCEGYALAYEYLCRKAGIECFTVTGTSPGGNAHAWNMVKLDGQWYHVDCTWDDPILTPEDREFIRYYYFLVNDSDIVGVTHIPDSTYYSYPVSAARDNYYKREGFYAESGEQGVNLLAVCAAEALEDGRKDAAVRFADRKSYDAAYSKLFDNKEILDVFAYVNSVSPRKVLDSRYVRYANNEELIIHISMIYDYE